MGLRLFIGCLTLVLCAVLLHHGFCWFEHQRVDPRSTLPANFRGQLGAKPDAEVPGDSSPAGAPQSGSSGAPAAADGARPMEIPAAPTEAAENVENTEDPKESASSVQQPAPTSATAASPADLVPLLPTRPPEVSPVQPAAATAQAAPVVAAPPRSDRSFFERTWFYSHRSCSNNPAAGCNGGFRKEVEKTKRFVAQMGILPNHTFCHASLPDYIMKDPRWGERYTKAGIRGRGYWFWKAAIAEHLLTDPSVGIQDGDWVIYADGDRYWLMRPLLELAKSVDKKTKPDLVIQTQGELEVAFSRGDVFGRFGVEPTNGHYGKTSQYKAQVFMLRINSKTRQFMKFWTELCADLHLVSGEKSNKTPDAHAFRKPREDQSLMSMLAKASLPGGCKGVAGASTALKGDACIHPEFGIPGLSIKAYTFR